MAISSLEDYVSKDMLENIVDKFYDCTHMVSSFSDYQGRYITQRKQFCSLCHTFSQSEEFSEYCRQCDALGGMHASLTKKPYIHICHAGLCDAQIPIIVDNTYLGMVLIGQVRLDTIPDFLPRMTQEYTYPNALFETREEFDRLYQESPCISWEEFNANIELMALIANYIADMGHHKLVQEQLLENERASAQEKQVQAELKNTLTRLQLQTTYAGLKPHFLMESFNAIYQQAIIEDATETANLIFSLNTLISRHISHPDMFVSVEEELRYIFNMISLRNISRYYTIHYQTYVDANAHEIRIPVSILQSLIENCYLDAIDALEQECDIRLDAVLRGNYLTIVISCPQVTLPVADLSGDKPAQSTHFWSQEAYNCIKNVRRSLALCYPDGFEFYTRATQDDTVEIFLKLPLLSRAEQTGDENL